MTTDPWGLLITIAIFLLLGLAIYSRVKKQNMKESVVEIREWITRKIKGE